MHVRSRRAGLRLSLGAVATAGQLPASCTFQGSGDGSDTYSVLASFGAKYDASAGDPKAGGEISQYFATGLAARALAARGGAAAVATGDAAKSSVLASPAITEGIEAANVSALQKRVTEAQSVIGAKVAAADINYRPLLVAMDGKAGRGCTDLDDACPPADDAAICAVRLVKGEGLSIISPDELKAATTATWSCYPPTEIANVELPYTCF